MDDNNHVFGAVVDLSQVCLKCGKKFTLLQFMAKAIPYCTAPRDDRQSALKCECGASKVGVGHRMIGHSSWCPAAL